MPEKPITDEIVGIEKDIFQDYIGKTLLNPDKVLRSESSGRGIEIYSDLLRDTKVGSTLQTRRLAVTGREWEVTPASDDSKDVRIADYVKQVLKAINLDAYRQAALSGLVLGFKACEIMWDYSEGDVFISKIIPRASRRFVFDLSNNLRLLTPKNMIEGEQVPARKFQIFTNPSDDGSPYGDGLGRLLYWPVWFKKNAIKFWMIFADKFGSPTAVGKYPSGATKEQQDALLDAIDAIQQESAIKIPDTMVIELLEAARQGSVNTYESLCNFMDKQIAQVMLGHTGTSEATPGKLGSEDAASEVRQDYIKADADLLCESENNQMVKWLMDYNFPNIARNGYPKVWIRTEQEKDLEPLARRDETLVRMGARLTHKYVYDTYAIQKPKEGDEILNPQTPSPQFPAASGKEFTESASAKRERFTPEQQSIEGLVEKAVNQAGDAMQGNEESIVKAIEGADSFEDAITRILELYPQMDMDRLSGILERSTLMAGIFGKWSAETKTE